MSCEYDPADLPGLIQPILDGAFEVVYGSRFKGSAAGLSYTHRVANRLLNVTVNVLFNRYLSDVYTGYKFSNHLNFPGGVDPMWNPSLPLSGVRARRRPVRPWQSRLGRAWSLGAVC